MNLLILFSIIILIIATYFFLSFKTRSLLAEEKKRKALEKVSCMKVKNGSELCSSYLPAGIILIDDKGTIIEVNTSFL